MRRCLISRRPPSSSFVSFKLSQFKQVWQKCPIPTGFFKTKNEAEAETTPAFKTVCSVHSRAHWEGCPSSWASHLSQMGLVLPPSEHLPVPALQCGRGSWRSWECWPQWRAKEEEVGEGSHNWEHYGYHDQNVAKEKNPNLKETKPRWCSYLWDDWLNSHNVLPVTICRATSTKKRFFDIKEELEGKRHKLWSSDNTHELDKLIVMSVSWTLYLRVKN